MKQAGWATEGERSPSIKFRSPAISSIGFGDFMSILSAESDIHLLDPAGPACAASRFAAASSCCSQLLPQAGTGSANDAGQLVGCDLTS